MNVFKPLKILAQVDDLGEIRCYIESRLSGFNIRKDADCDDILLASMEAITNILIHGYQEQKGLIEVDIAIGRDTVTVRLRDQAPAFDLDCIPTPDTTSPLEDRPLGGLGVHLVRKLMDKVTCKPLPGHGNELTLVKRVQFED